MWKRQRIGAAALVCSHRPSQTLDEEHASAPNCWSLCGLPSYVSLSLPRRCANRDAISVAANTPKGRQTRFQTTLRVTDGSPPCETLPKNGPSHAMYAKPKMPNATVHASTGRSNRLEYAMALEQTIADTHNVPAHTRLPYARNGRSSTATSTTHANTVNTMAQTPVSTA